MPKIKPKKILIIYNGKKDVKDLLYKIIIVTTRR